MPEMLLDLVDSFRGTPVVTAEHAFAGEGTSVRAWRGRRAEDPGYQRSLAEAMRIWTDARAGDFRAEYRLREALTTSDFPLLTADIIDRTVLAMYRMWIPTWTAYAARRTVRDFRTVKVFPPAYGLDLRLTAVKEQEEYPEATLTEQAAITYAVQKYGRRVAFSWEALVNDDLEQLMGIPERFARAAARTEQRFVVELFVDVNGPHASFYTSGNKNQIITANGAASNNPPLSIAALQDGFKILASMKDEQGEPIFIDAVTLVVPPALQITAENILNALQIWITTTAAGGQPPNPATAGQQQLIAQNWMRNKITLVVDPYIPATASTANGNTSWFLFADPNNGRPAIQVAFLRGHETPETFMKSPNATRVGGGGLTDPMDGDFDTDSVQWKIRHVIGGSMIDPRMSVASNGSGT